MANSGGATPASGSAPSGGNTRSYLLLGLATGVFSGLLGIGGAAILVPGMVNLMRLTQHQATGTSLMVIIPTATLAAIVYAIGAQGTFDWEAVAIYALASVVGAVLGARVSARLSASALRRAFGVFLVLISIRMFLG